MSTARRVLVALACNFRTCNSDAVRAKLYAKCGRWDAVVTVNEGAGLSEPKNRLFHIECNFKGKRGTARLVETLHEMFPQARAFDVRLDCVCLVGTYYRSNYGVDWVTSKLELFKTLPGCSVVLPETKKGAVIDMLDGKPCPCNVRHVEADEDLLPFYKLATATVCAQALNADGKLDMLSQIRKYVDGFYVFT